MPNSLSETSTEKKTNLHDALGYGALKKVQSKNAEDIRTYLKQVIEKNRMYLSPMMTERLKVALKFGGLELVLFWNSPYGKRIMALILQECFFKAYLDKLYAERWTSALNQATREREARLSSHASEKLLSPNLDAKQEQSRLYEEYKAKLNDFSKDLDRALTLFETHVDNIISEGRETLDKSDREALENPGTPEAYVPTFPQDMPHSEYFNAIEKTFQQLLLPHPSAPSKLPEKTPEEEQYIKAQIEPSIKNFEARLQNMENYQATLLQESLEKTREMETLGQFFSTLLNPQLDSRTKRLRTPEEQIIYNKFIAYDVQQQRLRREQCLVHKREIQLRHALGAMHLMQSGVIPQNLYASLHAAYVIDGYIHNAKLKAEQHSWENLNHATFWQPNSLKSHYDSPDIHYHQQMWHGKFSTRT